MNAKNPPTSSGSYILSGRVKHCSQYRYCFRDVDCDVYAGMIDYKKTFDRIQHDKMIEILKKQVLRKIGKLRIEGDRTEYVKIIRGVRQGGILSLLTLYFYSGRIFIESLREMEKHIVVIRNWLNNIRYPYDTTVFSDNLQALKTIVNKIIAQNNRRSTSYQ